MSITTPTSLKSGSHPWRFGLVAWGLASAVTAVIGPFTTYTLFSLPERLLYWASLIGVAIVLGYTIRSVVLRFVQPEGLRTDLIGAALQSVILGVLIWTFNYQIIGFDIGQASWLMQHMGVVFLVCLAVVCIRQYTRRALASDPAPSIAAPEKSSAQMDQRSTAAFLRRLDDDLGEDLLRVSADDHYLLVVTAMGEGRVRMRFRDALEELEALPGHQIHRSHWVARDALVDVRAEGRRHVARLRDGSEVPVSQAGLMDLEQAGLIPAARSASEA